VTLVVDLEFSFKVISVKGMFRGEFEKYFVSLIGGFSFFI